MTALAALAHNLPADLRRVALSVALPLLFPSCGNGCEATEGSKPNVQAPDVVVSAPSTLIPGAANDAQTSAAPDAGAASGRCPLGMVFVEAQGRNRPPWPKTDAFCIDRTEVTVTKYAACVRAHSCGVPVVDSECNWGVESRRNHPINCVTHSQADIYCRYTGARLPTTHEWVWAARRGDDHAIYPWGGSKPAKQLCWSGLAARKGTCPVGSYPDGNTKDGISDLSGNVYEWTATPGKMRIDTFVVHGGSWIDDDAGLVRSDVTQNDSADSTFSGVGFRCVTDLTNP